MRAEAKRHFEQWFPLAVHAQKLGRSSIIDDVYRNAAFMLHHRAILSLRFAGADLYSPKSHRLSMLRTHAERVEPRLIEISPRESKFARRCFSRLDRAYVDARYSSHYEITIAELGWLVEHIQLLQVLVERICLERTG